MNYLPTYYSSSSLAFCRFGFNGQEKDNEIAGKGNSVSSEFWMYDVRLGRRRDIDPLYGQYPYQSPYSAFNNNPIYFVDPNGASGVAYRDEVKREIVVKSNMYFYGPNASKQQAAQSAYDIQVQWNRPKGITMIDGVVYKVRFEVSGFYKSEEEAVQHMNKNTQFINNYVYVNEQGAGKYHTSVYFGNTGVFKHAHIHEKSRTEAHEMGHGWGLDHPKSPLVSQMSIMIPRASYWNNIWIKVDPEKRLVTQKDIDDLGLDKVKWNNGKANIGFIDNVNRRWETDDPSGKPDGISNSPDGGVDNGNYGLQGWDGKINKKTKEDNKKFKELGKTKY